jgi:integrase
MEVAQALFTSGLVVFWSDLQALRANFPTKAGGCPRRHRARDKVGLKGLHFRGSRHSAASELINAGVDLYTVGRVLGLNDARSTQRYAHAIR